MQPAKELSILLHMAWVRKSRIGNPSQWNPSGLIYTDIHASLGDPDRVKKLENVVPMKRGGLPEEVAEAIMWLLSPEAST